MDITETNNDRNSSQLDKEDIPWKFRSCLVSVVKLKSFSCKVVKIRNVIVVFKSCFSTPLREKKRLLKSKGMLVFSEGGDVQWDIDIDCGECGLKIAIKHNLSFIRLEVSFSAVMIAPSLPLSLFVCLSICLFLPVSLGILFVSLSLCKIKGITSFCFWLGNFIKHEHANVNLVNYHYTINVTVSTVKSKAQTN